ncbi:hypothetical protein PFICI_07957 [Pestalotiopsis fici W106-1]|uniref:Ketosynthase family 3 (KS3) domain-containing protein n=1 Tax=Pestalotiopsis fici (strain W106-1 / CGMCC3.15140) TaxID=1229662 RepID=W3X2Q9_PESFW|nr:uncharacterized protein PFICI_07957 [Pestalotiopsis fici W106-1]ETS80428.1 hypothetical protein PFICI_07957 [Pestalotiopsis fici W106-1]
MGFRLEQEPIAVIGMAFKFPGGADSPDNLWNVLANKKCVATKFPNDRFNIDAFSETSRKKDNTIKTDEAHFLEGDIRHFDAGFFSTAPHKAAAMDHQQRGLMETTYHAFENAGLGIQDVSGSRASVHVGCFTSDFANMRFLDIQAIPKYNALGSAGSILANRISWFYDLRGESMYVDTACSSSLVAMALACQGLTAGDADMAIVGASNVILGPEFNVSLSNMNFLSPRGRCHSFDSNADGYGRGEGFAALILKPMSKALADGNPIRAVDMQVQLIRYTYHKAELDMSETRFFDAHGTGTKVGDPIEARAIGEAFFKYRSKEDPIYVSVVKDSLELIRNRYGKPVRMRSFGAGVPLSLEIRTPGLLDTIEWAEDTVAYSPLGPDQVEIRVQAIGVNLKECLTLLGRVNIDRLGSECSGFIVRVGAAVKHLETGDRVVLGSLETYKTLVRAESFQVVKIPQAMSFTEAAAIPTAFCTAYHSLYRVARLQKGESVLIHAAAGGTGQAALQIAQHIGAVIFATVGSVEKRKLLIEHYGISEDHIFNSRDASFAEGIKRVTNGRGVDVVLNSLSGKLLVASWEIIAEFGRFIEIGRKDIDTRGYLPMFPFIKNAMFAGVDLAAIVDGGGTSGRYVLQEVFDLMETGALRPLHPITPFPVDQTEQAFRLLQSGRSMGKIVLELHDSSLVPFREGSDSQYRLSRNATYVVSGGLGGIGRQIVRWLVRRGAQHLLLLTRSGISGSPAKAKMIAELESQQIQVQCQVCDIGDFESLTKTVEEASKTMPPFRGCFQAAMVIQDRPFANMSYAEWHDAIRPKIQGSWNLHKALPSGMDFFVMLSSSVGVFGNAGQSNYAAGNTFQDALARCRVEQGEKAAAIDLGMILGEGFVAERADIRDKLMRLNLLLPLTLPELFAVFDYYCDPDTALTCPEKSQIVTGIEAPAIIRQSGREVPEPLFRTLFRALHQITPVGAVSTTGTAKVQDVAAVIQELPR